jgi:hypothetical protein
VRVTGSLGVVVAALALPASSFGAVTIGSNLTAGGTETNACSGGGCTFAQVAPLPSGHTAAGGLVSPADGVVTRWRIKSGSAQNPVKLRILRPTGGGAFTAVGTSATGTTGMDVTQFDTRLSIKAGDYIGVDNANDALIFAPTPGASIYKWTPQLADGSNRAADATSGTLELMAQADIEPDVDCDGLGDETQDTNTADGPCAQTGGGGGGGTMADIVAPTLSALTVKPLRPRAGRSLTLGFTVSEAAHVVTTIESRRAGRRAGKRCVRPTKRNRARKRCTRYVLVQMLASDAPAGAGALAFKLKLPGRYRATLVAADAAKNVSLPMRVSFRVRP